MTAAVNFNTVERVIVEAYENAGLIAMGSYPNSDQYARGLNKLNTIVNYLQTQGIKLWTQVDTPMVLVAGTNFYPLGAGQTGISMTKPLRAPFVYFLSATGARTPMTPVSWQEWVNLPLQTSALGQPVNYFIDKQATLLGVYLWPTPDALSATGSAHLVLQTQIPNAQGLTDTTAFPPEWFSTLAWGLADELCTGQPEAIVQRCAGRYLTFRTALENWDVEDAQVFFTPDMRGGAGGNSFA